MSTHSLVMGRPGYTLRIGTSAQVAGNVIGNNFVAAGFRSKSAPGVFPMKLTYSSMAASVCIEWFSEIVPIILVPAAFRRTLPIKVRIRVLDHSERSSTLRVDMDTYDSTWLAFLIFDKALRSGLTALTDQGITVEMDPLTDSVLERRNRRKKR